VARSDGEPSRVVYVDSDPVAVAHSRSILAGDPHTAVVHADLRRPESILDDPVVREQLDLTRPVAVLMVAVLHFLSDEDEPVQRVAQVRNALAPGSFVVVSHASADGRPEFADSHRQLYRRTATPMSMRSRDQVAAFFDGLELVDPGLVWLPLWRPDASEPAPDRPERTTGLAGVGRKV
jgi:SAM-dependent methyltransferase